MGINAEGKIIIVEETAGSLIILVKQEIVLLSLLPITCNMDFLKDAGRLCSTH